MKKILISICLVYCIMLPTASQVRGEMTKAGLINEFMRDSMKKYKIPGASLAIVQDGKLIYQEGFGEQSNGASVTKDTMFTIGSVSKPITSLAIMKLVDGGEVNLDQEISQYLPHFHYNQDSSNQEVTIRQLLTHTSGISSYDGLVLSDRNLRGEDAIAKAVQEMSGVSLKHEPGEVHEYSPANYLLLAKIVENVTNQPFATFMHDEIFNRIGMNRTASNFRDAQEIGYQPGFQSWFGKPIKSKGFMDDSGVPYGYMVSTSDDISKFIRFMMNGGRELLSEESFSMYTSPQVHRKEDMYYGYGWRISTRAEDSYYFHGGETPDSRSELFINPNRGYGFVLLTNKNNFSEVLSTIWMRDGIKAILENGTMPEVKPVNHHIQWSVFFITVFLFLLCFWNVCRLITKVSIKKKVWMFIGSISILLAIGIIPLLCYFFSTPWRSINLYAPDIAFIIKLLVGTMTLNGVLLLMITLLKRSEARHR